MKMNHTQLVAEMLVNSLVGNEFVLTEDRIDNLIARYPDAKLDKRQVLTWLEFDPTRNKKYMPWLITQVAKGQLKLPEQGEVVRDDLMTFERLLVIPAYKGPRDIYQIKSQEELHNLMREHGELKSKSAEEKEKKQAGVEVVAKEGAYTLLKITNAESLSSWAWKAYSADNPNWKKPPVVPRPNEDLSDGLWCVRFPRYASSYLSAGPFYLVLKNGGPYVGIVWERGECQTLENRGISTAMAAEIYPVVRSVLPDGHGGRNVRVFDNIKFLHGDVKDGDTVTGPVDLANTNLTSLPSNLTVRGNLDISNTQIAALPPGLKVEGVLKTSGTPIADIPEDLVVEEIEWSEPLTLEQMKMLLYRMRLPEMEVHYKQWMKDQKALPPEKREKDPKTGKPKKILTWPQMAKALIKHFLKSAEIDKNVKMMYRYVAPSKPQTPDEG